MGPYPVRTEQDTLIPPLKDQPQVNSWAEQAALVPENTKLRAEWAASSAPAQQAQQRLMTLTRALQASESGEWATLQAELNTRLRALGLPGWQVGTNDPADIQTALCENFSQTMSTLKSQLAGGSGRVTQAEIFRAAEQQPGPNLQPKTNRALIAEALGVVSQAQQLPQDWALASRMGWQDATAYDTAWPRTNKLSDATNWWRNYIGPMKGELVEGATGTRPDGSRVVVRNGQVVPLGAGPAPQPAPPALRGEPVPPPYSPVPQMPPPPVQSHSWLPRLW